MRYDEDFAEYVVARWPGLVRQAVALGCPPGAAEDTTRVVLTGCLAEWASVRDETDPDRHVQRRLEERIGRGRRSGRTSGSAPLLTELAVGPVPLQRMLEDAGAMRRRRTRRTLRLAVGVTAAITLASGLAHSLGLFTQVAEASRPANSLADKHPPFSGPVAGDARSRATGRPVAAALGYAVGQVAGGGQSDFAGQEWSGAGARRQVYAQLVWTPERGDASVVRLVLRPPGSAARSTCAGRAACTETTLPDGDVVRSWSEAGVPVPGAVTRYAERQRPSGLRVEVSSSNAADTDLLPGDPVLLDAAQLTRIVSEPWWGLTMPDSFFTDGGHLSAYVDLRLSVPAYPTAGPSS